MRFLYRPLVCTVWHDDEEKHKKNAAINAYMLFI